MRNYIIHFFTVIVFFSCQMSAHAQNAVQDCEKDIIKLWAEGDRQAQSLYENSKTEFNSKWLSRIQCMAKKGDPDSQLTLGIVYRDGSDGLPQNYLSAMEWFKKAAEQGDAMAQLNLGKLYKNGHGPPIDYVQAHMWFNIAVSTFASQGRNSQSLKYTFNLRDELASKMSSQQINAAQQLAKKMVGEI